MNFSTFQMVALPFLAVLLGVTLQRYRQRYLSGRELLFWSTFWCCSAVVVALPYTTQWLALKVGIGRGVDLVNYVILFFLLFSLFRQRIVNRRLEQHVTILVRELALLKDTIGSINDTETSASPSETSKGSMG